MDAESEAELEGDNSKVPAKLRAALNGLGQAFKDMAAEEVTELLAVGNTRKAAEADTLRKAAVDEALTPEALAKVAGERDDLAQRLAERDDQLTKVAERVEPLAKAVENLTERLARVEAAPLPPKTAANTLAKAVSKEADSTGQLGNADKPQLSNEDVQKALASMSPEDRAMTLTKAALARPIAVSTR
jgi:Holliday junction resolvasome RuvABC endonuclease subunit